jgi:hypothetical protein
MALCNSCTTFVIYCTMSAQFRNEFRRVFMPATVKCWLSPDSIRRCSDAYIPSFAANKSQVTYLRPSLNGGETNDHSITLTVVGSTNSVRKFNSNFDTPLPSPQPMTTTMLTENGNLSAAIDSGGSMASTLTVDAMEGDEHAKLLNDTTTINGSTNHN